MERGDEQVSSHNVARRISFSKLIDFMSHRQRKMEINVHFASYRFATSERHKGIRLLHGLYNASTYASVISASTSTFECICCFCLDLWALGEGILTQGRSSFLHFQHCCFSSHFLFARRQLSHGLDRRCRREWRGLSGV